MKICKKIMTASLLIAAGYGSIAFAHTTPAGSSLVANPATDIYSVTCSNNGAGVPTELFIQVRDDTAAAPQVSIQAKKGTSVSLISTDTTGADGVYSTGVTFVPPASAGGGAGVYTLSVFKSPQAAGTQNYVGQFHCQTATHVHTGTTFSMTQNQ